MRLPEEVSKKREVTSSPVADWSVAPQTSLTFYIAGVRGGGVAKRIYPDGRSARFVYIELTQRF